MAVAEVADVSQPLHDQQLVDPLEIAAQVGPVRGQQGLQDRAVVQLVLEVEHRAQTLGELVLFGDKGVFQQPEQQVGVLLEQAAHGLQVHPVHLHLVFVIRQLSLQVMKVGRLPVGLELKLGGQLLAARIPLDYVEQQARAKLGEEDALHHIQLLELDGPLPAGEQHLGGGGHHPHEGAHPAQDQEDGQHLAQLGLGRDVAVAHRGDGHHREIDGVGPGQALGQGEAHRAHHQHGQHGRQEYAQAKGQVVHGVNSSTSRSGGSRRAAGSVPLAVGIPFLVAVGPAGNEAHGLGEALAVQIAGQAQHRPSLGIQQDGGGHLLDGVSLGHLLLHADIHHDQVELPAHHGRHLRIGKDQALHLTAQIAPGSREVDEHRLVRDPVGLHHLPMAHPVELVHAPGRGQAGGAEQAQDQQAKSHPPAPPGCEGG
eukprot:TRINITY_DN6108_c4_g1_i1.p2 TRINITY_DN6108_c4_g1~~TRINITY_DN6108_c4_g1_i1.p2  ORF type:complete len:427 (+),score=118.73 TRINITY_DN6108_c4_g1_i1:892-2172(+)